MAGKKNFQTFGKFHRACTGKRGYESKAEAKRAAKRFDAKEPGPPTNVYKCGLCGLFHTGHKPWWKRKPSDEPEPKPVNPRKRLNNLLRKRIEIVAALDDDLLLPERRTELERRLASINDEIESLKEQIDQWQLTRT